MTDQATRYLYLTRHAEAQPDETALTASGRHQAVLLGQRLRDVPFAAIHHGPLPRAAQTARLITQQLTTSAPLHESEPAGDYVPHIPKADDLPPGAADYLHQSTARADLANSALELFTEPAAGSTERHELLVTHNFLIGWLVGRAMSAPDWRWLSLSHCNAALTVIRYTPGRLSSVLMYNDMSHLPSELRWTGFPDMPLS
ncbi:histidine phosphatase family protein [Kribbella sp. WER1]